MNPELVARRVGEEPATQAARRHAQGRGAVYLVGGTLRDAALGIKPLFDIDLAVEKNAGAFSRSLAKTLRGTSFPLHEAQQIYRVVAKRSSGPNWQFDVALLQGSLSVDLARRDFTVNAMALRLDEDAELVDPFDGLKDLSARVLRLTSAKVLEDDPLRLLRAFRISAQHGLTIEKSALREISKRSALISRCAGERLRSELMLLLSTGPAAGHLRRMDEAGLLTALIPELEPERRCASVYYGKGGVLKHSLDAVERCDFLFDSLPAAFPKHAAALSAWLDASANGRAARQGLVRLAVLLHDLAKPATAKKIGGRLRFFGHEALGAKMSDAVLKRLRFSRQEIEEAHALVLHHLRPGNLAANGVVSDKAVHRFFRDLGEHGLSLLLLCWSDHASYLSPQSLAKVLPFAGEDPQTFKRSRLKSEEERKTLYHLQVISLLVDRWFSRPDTVRPKRILTGTAVMKALKIPPGPRVGELLRLLEEAQAEGRVKTRTEALTFLRSDPKN